MKEFITLDSQGSQQLLDKFNRPYTTEEILAVLDSTGDDSLHHNLAKAIMQRRSTLGSFTDIDQLKEIDGFNGQVYNRVVSSLIQPSFPVNEEKLEQVVWVHGSSLQIEHPDHYSNIVRKATGTRITGTEYDPPVPNNNPFLPEAQGQSRPSISNVFFSIPTPIFQSGNRVAVRTILLNFIESDVFPHWVTEVSLWDGHIRIFKQAVGWFRTDKHRNVRIGIPSRHQINYGIVISLKVGIWPHNPPTPNWIEFAAAGVEFVSGGGGQLIAQ